MKLLNVQEITITMTNGAIVTPCAINTREVDLTINNDSVNIVTHYLDGEDVTYYRYTTHRFHTAEVKELKVVFERPVPLKDLFP